MSGISIKPDNGRYLTERELKAALRSGASKIIEPGGLKGMISKKGSIRWTYRFRSPVTQTIREMSIGAWPADAMSAIRANRDVAAQQVADGLDPIVALAERQAERRAAVQLDRIEAERRLEAELARRASEEEENKTVADLFGAWVVDGVARKDGNDELRRSFGVDVLPAIGQIPLRSLCEAHILSMLRCIADRGVKRTVEVVFDDFKQMLSWAEKRQPWRRLLIDGNPADLVDVRLLLPQNYTGRRGRFLIDDEIVELKSKFDLLRKNYAEAPAGTKYSIPRPLPERQELGVWIALSTLCRVGELLQAKWENVNLEKGEWLIPADESKGRADTVGDFLVFLSPFSLCLFKRLHELTGKTGFCFPAASGKAHVGLKSLSRSIADRQANLKNRAKKRKGRREDDSLVLSGGRKGDWTLHDLRRTGATLMQRFAISLDIIDRCQNHVLAGSKTRLHYMLYAYESEKRAAWARLGSHLEQLFSKRV